MHAPFSGVVVRLLTASALRITICAVLIRMLGASSLAYVVKQIPSERPHLLQRIFIWTIAPFVPAYLVTVFVTAALLKR
jgi:hypothetical protein